MDNSENVARVEQAGGIVFRRDGDDVTVLLVRSKKDPSIWVFPKGHIEPGETADAAALRETREEAGVDGEVLGRVGAPLEFMSGIEPVRVRYFLIRATGTVPPAERREKRWFSIDDARRALSFESARELMADAADVIRASRAPTAKS